MSRLRTKFVGKIDQLNIHRKLVLMYVFCVMLPLLITDSVVFSVVYQSEREAKMHEMENVANAVHYTFFNEVDLAAQLGKGVYTSKYVNDFINTRFSSNLEYFSTYSKFFDDTLIDLVDGANGLKYTFYLDNDTIVSGSEMQSIGKAKNADWYNYMIENELKRGLYFGFNDARKIYYFQRLNFYDKNSKNVLLIEIDYGTMVRTLVNLQYDDKAFICDDERIYISNGTLASAGRSYYPLSTLDNIAYTSQMSLYGLELDINIVGAENPVINSLHNWGFLIILLILVNVYLPAIMMDMINRSFTIRISELSGVFGSVNMSSDKLLPIENPRGQDEIGELMRGYNLMVEKINDLIQIVYVNTIKEQEMMVARQNAELLALHSQINPHFLFNALESIRMHSLLKHELETADMVEKLAKMQRQYTEWQNDMILLEKEIEFVEAYLGLQKYRFGDRLSYQIDVEDDCSELEIPKLTIVTFVENACIHGIESKTTPGWLFVRISREEDFLVMEIEDTGNGMEAEELTALLYKMQNANIDMLREKGRVGIVNACLRLKMISDNRVLFDIDSEEGIGTIVTIKLPIK